MISAKKFARLSPKRQIFFLLQSLPELEARQKQAKTHESLLFLEEFYQSYLAQLISQQMRLGLALQEQWQRWAGYLQLKESEEPTAEADKLRCELEALLLQCCQQEPSDWSENYPERYQAVVPPVATPYLGLYLDRVRSPFNIGAIFRSAAAFGVHEVWLHPHCPDLQHPRAQRSAMGCIDLLPSRRCAEPQAEEPLRQLPWVALETPEFSKKYCGNPISHFSFPSSGGLLLVGTEEHGLAAEILEYTASLENRRNGGSIVSIPMAGPKQSLNLGVASGIALQRWAETLASS